MNIQRHGGGKIHEATSAGTPWCAPNGRPTRYGTTNATSYQQTTEPVDCQRCRRLFN